MFDLIPLQYLLMLPAFLVVLTVIVFVHEMGHFLTAGAAPGCPEIEHHHLPLVVGQRHGLAIEGAQFKGWSRLSHLGSGVSEAGQTEADG